MYILYMHVIVAQGQVKNLKKQMSNRSAAGQVRVHSDVAVHQYAVHVPHLIDW